MFKRVIQNILARFGYAFRKCSTLVPFLPFVRQISLPGINFNFWIANNEAANWYVQKDWMDGAEFKGLQNLVRPGDSVLEIGSHHGFTALLISQLVGSSGRVITLEAHPENALICMAQIFLNKTVENIQIINMAASDAPKTIRMSYLHNSSVTTESANSFEISASTGDYILSEYGPFNVLKIDVEGHELSVLSGCRKLLNSRPRIELEIHLDLLQARGDSINDLFELINIEQYEGEMYCRDSDNPNDLVPFNPTTLPNNGIVNVFLKPKAIH